MFVRRVSFFFFFKQKTAYEMRISVWSSDVFSSDLNGPHHLDAGFLVGQIFNGFSVASIYILAAMGLALSFGLMRVINMAHGEILMEIGRASCRERVCQYV